MTIAVVLDDDWEVEPCLQWAGRFAQSRGEPLTVIVLTGKRDAEVTVQEIPSNARPTSSVGRKVISFIDTCDSLSRETYRQQQGVQTKIIELAGRDLSAHISELISKEEVSLLILPRHSTERGADPYTDWERDVLSYATCEMLQLNPAEGDRENGRGVLVPADSRLPSQLALRQAKQYCEALGLELTALYVEPNVDEYASDVGKHIIEQVVSRALGPDAQVHCRVVLGTSVKQAIADTADEGYELLLLGANRRAVDRRWIKASIIEYLFARQIGPTLAVIRPTIPLSSRLSARLSRLIKPRVPQLDRERRVSLVQRIQGSSQWDFDFVALTCLSTLIAALGLTQNSPAVVIGAMLVAPLMTPLVGAGLSLVQGNRLLMLRAASTVLRSFLVAFALAFVTGLLLPNLSETHEMTARGSPRALDFVVAFVSGTAAAYALGRPNLLSALPGVAIAAALVPPVATAGLATSLGNWTLAAGALLLFLTNIVAIVLGTAAALGAVGVRPTHEHGRLDSWVVRVGIALLLLGMAIAVYEVIPQNTIPHDLADQIQDSLQSATVLECKRPDTQHVLIVVANDVPLDDTVARSLGHLVRRTLGDDIIVQVETRLVTTVP